ncbi:MAG: class I tRNA ligase family protein [Patescibacteria group bacterium]
MENKPTIPQNEEEILRFWQENKIFEKSVNKNAPKGDYIFYDGPPFATGTPHYGHIVASLMKDSVPRYWTMQGYRVERKWGWDCHGLPIENIVEKEMNFQNKQDIEEKIGVDQFNEACRSKVLLYADEWKKFIPRLGRWVDMDNDYKTMDLEYMESIWWVFKQLWDKDLIYQGYKAMQICPRCQTTLSQSEVSQGYKLISDISVITKFKITDQNFLAKYCNGQETSFLAWTTTPWSIPTTMGLAIGANFDYVVVVIGNEQIICAKNRLEYILQFRPEQKQQIINTLKGQAMEHISYAHPFGQFYQDKPEVKSNTQVYKTHLTDYVSVEDGTGIVTINGAFGEIDMQAAKQLGLPIVVNVNFDGTFTSEMGEFAGINVKPIDDIQSTDKKVIAYLEKANALYAQEMYEHSYPHCWRCDTPLLNYATSSWFVNVTKIKPRLLELAKKINWVPVHLKEGRFGNWLEGAQDWSISRQRFWGSVLPIWKCDKCKETKVFGDKNELEKLNGQTITDLHKHTMDKITFPCQRGRCPAGTDEVGAPPAQGGKGHEPKGVGICSGTMHRIPDVLDCWFESGSMPYAQVHYPFENKAKFEATFPAQFIAEGVDQTRCWFYYLHVLSTAVMDDAAFDNVIANGIVLAEDGQKMSKRLKNYPDPTEVIDRYGADALRYYLLTSPVMKAETLNFSAKGVDEVYKKLILILSNVFSFYQMYANPKQKPETKSKNILDQWILSKLQLLLQEVTTQMDGYDLVQATRPIIDFIDQLSTWYLRRSRARFKADDVEDKQAALETLKYVLLNLSKILAPFTPFIAEKIYRELGGKIESVHLETWPKVDEKLINQNLSEQMDLVRQIVEAGLAARATAGIKIRQPLAYYSTSLIKKLDQKYINILQDELNVLEIKFGEDKLETTLTPELTEQGLIRELVRQINSLRKKAGLTIQDRINIYYQTSSQEITSVMTKYANQITKDTLSKELKNEKINLDPVYQAEAKVNEWSVWFGLSLKH